MDAYCGIDVACAKNKRLPVAVCYREGDQLRTLPLRTKGPLLPRGMGNRMAVDRATRAGFVESTATYLDQVQRQFGVSIREIAIDAPRRPSTASRRLCETAMDKARISCFATPSEAEFAELPARIDAHLKNGGSESRLPRANQLWMLVGFDLFGRLEQDYACVEVFPNAIVRAIAPGSAHKSRRDGFDAQLSAFAAAARWDRSELGSMAFGSRHDRLDALMSAWIASLPASQREAHGNGDLDTIWNVKPEAGRPSGRTTATAPAR